MACATGPGRLKVGIQWGQGFQEERAGHVWNKKCRGIWVSGSIVDSTISRGLRTQQSWFHRGQRFQQVSPFFLPDPWLLPNLSCIWAVFSVSTALTTTAIGDKIKLTLSSTLGVMASSQSTCKCIQAICKAWVENNVGALWWVLSTERPFLEVTFQREAPPGLTHLLLSSLPLPGYQFLYLGPRGRGLST